LEYENQQKLGKLLDAATSWVNKEVEASVNKKCDCVNTYLGGN
jgi:hypothetical protein